MDLLISENVELAATLDLLKIEKDDISLQFHQTKNAHMVQTRLREQELAKLRAALGDTVQNADMKVAHMMAQLRWLMNGDCKFLWHRMISELVELLLAWFRL